MVENKKGLSMIVSVLIIILLVLMAIGIVWVVVRNAIQSGTEQIDLGSKCLQTSVRITTALCDADGTTTDNCTVVLKRDDTGKDIGGIKLVFGNVTDSFTHDENGNIGVLSIKTTPPIDTGIANVTRIDVVVYFVDEAGNEQLCSGINTYKF